MHLARTQNFKNWCDRRTGVFINTPCSQQQKGARKTFMNIWEIIHQRKMEMRNCLLFSMENCKLIKQSITVYNQFRSPTGKALYQPPPEGWGLLNGWTAPGSRMVIASWNLLHLLFCSAALILEILIKTVKRVAHEKLLLMLYREWDLS